VTRLGEILGTGIDEDVQIFGWRPDKEHRPVFHTLPGEVLNRVLRPEGEDCDFGPAALRSVTHDAVAFVRLHSFGSRLNGPEEGNFINVSAGRTRASVALAIAAVMGAATACGGQVWDEGHDLSPARISGPDDLRAILVSGVPHATFDEGVDDLLSRTSFQDYLT
jgi:hypothetical protein